ncbi:MAG: 30S ribosomal protein S4 [Candidatus Moraniibacteriota bacterium]|nr:MAG: 30S ribosomal protein S4 [Candidatus Moranbacteria bacterium]
MARELNSKCVLCRRAGEKLFLKGDRCLTPKCAMVRRPYAPGMHGQARGKAPSEFGRQLAMKQKIKRAYGVLEAQFRRHFAEVQGKEGITGDLLLQRLEERFDNVVYRLGFSTSRAQARQLVSHGFFLLNGKKTDIPSCRIKVGDTIAIRKENVEKKYLTLLKEARKTRQNDTPGWLVFDESKWEGIVLAQPTRDHIEGDFNPQLVVEFYSK